MPTSKAHKQAASHGTQAAPNRYEILFDQASDAILTVDSNAKIAEVNQALEDLTGYLKSEIAGATVTFLCPSKEQLLAAKTRARPLSADLLSRAGTYEDIAIARKDGFLRFVDLHVRLVSDGTKDFTLVLVRDLTERRRMERELITKHSELKQAYVGLERKTAELENMQETLVQSGKMAALGELAAGIAHELNQPLQAIRGFAQEIQSTTLPWASRADTQQGEDLAASLKEIVGGVDKMRAIIDYLRTFTRKSTEGHEQVDVHAVIEESLKLLGVQLAARGIHVTREFAAGLPRVFANPLALEQVFINLATNARDAIEATDRGSGELKITTRNDGKFIEVCFADDGVGMNEKTKTKVFNPFFTTKEVGQGMGLGLSLSYGILNKIQGSLLVESELGKGAAFTVRLPKDFREV